MQLPVSSSLLEHLSVLPDPRLERTRRHSLVDIVAVAVCAVLGGADGWTDIELFGNCKLEWFKKFLELPNGIPSHDTFARVFSRLDPVAFEGVFRNWVQSVQGLVEGVIAIDGKVLKGSGHAPSGQSALHLVSAWAVANRMVLGQVQTQAKSNEVTAIPELLQALDIKGCIVTLDAMGCQKAIARQIIEQQGDYVLALKANHGNLHHEVEMMFEIRRERQFVDRPHSYYETLDKDHGRIEVRRHWVVPVPEYMGADVAPWTGLQSLVMVERERIMGAKTSLETHYYLSSLPVEARPMAEAVRAHWEIENGLHWMMDVTFNEDKCQVRKDHAPANLARVRRLAQALVRQDTTTKASLRGKRHKAGWDNDYLLRLLVDGNV